MPKKGEAQHEFVQKVSGMMPQFREVFDEETFYIFFIVLTIVVIAAAFVLARKVKLKDAGHID